MTMYYRVYCKIACLDTEAKELAMFSCEMKPHGDAKLTPVDKKYRRHPALEHSVFIPKHKMHESPEAAIEAYRTECKLRIQHAESNLRLAKEHLREAEEMRDKLIKGESLT
jgi:hypothetical protein